MMKSILWAIMALFCLLSTETSAQDCKGQPGFIKALGFDPARSALSTTERRFMGAVLIELEDPRNTQSRRLKTHQDPSWKSAGYLGAVATDKEGNLYVIPKPNVNMLHNKAAEQNTVHRIDSRTGKMQAFERLPMKHLPHERNPYGLIGSFFDCTTEALILSSLAGSDQKKELGQIWTLGTRTRKYSEILQNVDAIGVGVYSVQNERRLFYGLARKSELWSVALTADNRPQGKPRLELSLEGLGPRGDDRIKKIRFQPNGRMDLTGTPFYYNLTAPVDGQESIYSFQTDPSSGQWRLIGIR
jgi:hypothetical protein